MLRNKVSKISKGYSLLYTLIIFSCCFIIFLNIFTLFILEYKNVKISEQEFYNENLLENDKIYLTNMLLEKVNDGVTILNIGEAKESVRNQLENNSNILRFNRGKSVLYYDAINDEFILKTKLNVLDSCYEIYNYEIRDNVIRLVYDRIVYR